MSHASRRDNTTSASLFPFLAVLLSTMGVLVVLLVVMASVQLTQAESKELAKRATSKAAHDSDEQRSLRQQLAELQAHQEELAQARGKATQRLRDEEQRLSQIEENIRRRQERLELLRAQIEELHALGGDSNDDVQAAEAELARRRELIAEAKAEIDKLTNDVGQQARSYAIVPYVGDQGTRRRPIYIECRRDLVVFQPENIVLTAADFNSALAAGAPLPAAVRAAQRYYIDHGMIQTEQPYPLVIVRPDAAATFFRVLSTLGETNADFGYEIVDADWELDYSAANPALSGEIRQAIENARQRLAALRQTAPGRFAGNSSESFELGPSLLDRIKQGKLPANYSPIGVRQRGTGEQEVVIGNEPINVGRLAETLKAAVDESSPTHGSDPSSLTEDSQFRVSSASTAGDRYSAAAMEGMSTDLQGGADSGGSEGNSEHPSMAAAGPSGASEGALNTDGDSPTAAAEMPGNSAQDPETMANMDNPMGDTPASGLSAIGSDTSPSAGTPSRGSQVPGMALVRTIRVQVHPQQLVVKSGKTAASMSRITASDKVIALDGNIRQAAIDFARAIKDEVHEWGIAGEGLYWKAVLEMTVAPGGEDIARRLAAALKQSGVEVRLAARPQ